MTHMENHNNLGLLEPTFPHSCLYKLFFIRTEQRLLAIERSFVTPIANLLKTPFQNAKNKTEESPNFH